MHKRGQQMQRVWQRPAEALWLAGSIWSERVAVPLLSGWTRMRLRAWGATVGIRLRVYGRLRIANRGILTVGSDVCLRSGDSNYVGGDRRLSLWIGREGHLSIGDRCGLSNSTIVCQERVCIGAGTLIGGGCEIYDTDFHSLDAGRRSTGADRPATAPIQIGARVFVGSWCIILKGVCIGDGAVIGAGSVVTRSIPPGEVWAGVPARCIRSASGDRMTAL